MNKIYFGAGNKAIGIYAASRYYFDKSVQNLTLPEAALLAGTLNSPTAYDPFRNLDLAQKRRDIILNLMRDHGYITEEECEATKAIPVENTLKSNPIVSGGKYQAYADKVYREVVEKTNYDPYETPMKIYTYIDTDLQEKLDAIASGEAYQFYTDDLQLGASVQETQTGHIVGIISARDYEPMGLTYAYAGSKESGSSYGQRNQPGSSLKPIIAYAAAFEFLNYSTAHYVHDVPLTGSYNPKNWSGQYYGDITIKDALINSWNLAAIQTYLEIKNGNGITDGVGADKIIEYLEGFGFDMYGEKESVETAGFAIGNWSTGVSPEEEAAAFAAIANGGTYIEPHTVSKIEILATGEVIDLESQYQAEKKQAISAESAFMIREIMIDFLDEAGSYYSPLDIGYQIGAKSGTTTYDSSSGSLNGKAKDGWMTAFSPDYSWSVWTGFDSQHKQELKTNKDVNQVAAMIAKYVHKGSLKNSYPSQPDGIVKASCISGIYPYVAPGDGVPNNRIATGWFKKENTPSGSASGAALNNLESFTATYTNGKISVQFAEYDPKSMTETGTPTKQYKTADGKTYTLPYLGDITQIYGKVVYVAEVVDGSGTVVHTEKFSTNLATLNYTPKAGNYTINGYYSFENGGSTSNKVAQTITVEAALAESSQYEVISQTESKIVLQVSVPSGNILTIGFNDKTKDITESSQVTLKGVEPGTIITFTDTRSDGKVYQLPSLEIPNQDENNEDND